MILKTTLKKLRLRKHITQKELAEMCGISQGTIGDIERGANASTVITFIYLVIPSSILISSGISKYFEEEYQKPAVVELNKNFDKLTKVKDELFTLEENKSIFNIPAQIDGTKQKLKNLTNEIEIVSKNIIDYTPIIVGIMLLSYIILPLIILFLLYKLVRIIFVEKLFKQ